MTPRIATRKNKRKRKIFRRRNGRTCRRNKINYKKYKKGG